MTRQPPAPALDLDLHLPSPPRAATRPAEFRGVDRDGVRLLVLDSQTGNVQHDTFAGLDRYLRPGDLLVVNTSATVPARLLAVSAAREQLILHLSTRCSQHEVIAERRTADGGPDARPFAAGARLSIVRPGTGAPFAEARVIEPYHPRSRLWRLRSECDLFAVARTIGSPIRYGYVDGEYGASAYQTVFARTPGSAEMPSAARPFTHRLLRQLAHSGVRFASLILHTGVSSHEVERDLASHPVLPEWYHIPPATAQAVHHARQTGGRVVAVGTTVVRALESAVDLAGTVHAGTAWTRHLVTPETPPRVVDGLVTGLHDTHSSHLALLYAFVPAHHLRRAYAQALDSGYLWHEFGDGCLVLPVRPAAQTVRLPPIERRL